MDTLTMEAHDPRLRGWYQTVELGDGVVSHGLVDLREQVDIHLPATLEGKSALDVGTANGFWAFEMEQRGARVTAIDVETWGDFDYLPQVRNAKAGMGNPTGEKFDMAHRMRGSTVERRICSVYDLSPEFGTFDFVFCGSLLMHLQNPLLALTNICSVTREQAVVTTLHSEELERAAPDVPAVRFGQRWPDLDADPSMLGSECVYWKMNITALRDMMAYAGFSEAELIGIEPLTPLANTVCMLMRGYP